MSQVWRRPVVDISPCDGDVIVTIEWDGIEDFTVTLNTLSDVAPGDVAGALFEEGEGIMSQAKTDTPVEFGRLRSTGHVQRPVVRGTAAEVTLAFGTDYAVFVHEIRDAVHTVGRAKFLEAAAKAALRGMPARVARRTKARWKARWGNAVR